MWTRVSVQIRGSSSWKMVTFRARADQLFRNLTDILQLLEVFQKIISRLGTIWTCLIKESLFKPRIHLSILATFYLAGSALCKRWMSIRQWHLSWTLLKVGTPVHRCKFSFSRIVYVFLVFIIWKVPNLTYIVCIQSWGTLLIFDDSMFLEFLPGIIIFF